MNGDVLIGVADLLTQTVGAVTPAAGATKLRSVDGAGVSVATVEEAARHGAWGSHALLLLRLAVAGEVVVRSRATRSPVTAEQLVPYDLHQAGLAVTAADAARFFAVLSISTTPPPVQPAAVADNAPGPAPTRVRPGWIAQAQAEARQIIERDRARDCYPSQQMVAEEIERSFRDRKIVGAKGLPIRATTIKRAALRGIESGAAERARGTGRRGEWGDEGGASVTLRKTQ